MKRLTYFLAFSLMAVLGMMTTGTVLAQEMMTPTDLADAKPGECYAQVYTPAQWTTQTKRVLKNEASFRLETVPAVYETVTERVLVKGEGERLEVIPATYETVTERVMIKEAGTRLETVPAVYETETERVLVRPARQVWKNSKGTIYGTAIKDAEGKLITKPSASGEVLCLVEEPAEYRTVSKRVLKKEATTREVTIPAEYKTVSKRVMKTPPSTRKVTIPAEYQTVTKRVVKSPATTRRIEIPAEYETVTERVMAEEASMEWVPVLCDVNVTSATIREIQNGLKLAGHYSGPIDGVFGTGTSRGIQSFQRAKNLSQGYGLTLQTIQALNVKY